MASSFPTAPPSIKPTSAWKIFIMGEMNKMQQEVINLKKDLADKETRVAYLEAQLKEVNTKQQIQEAAQEATKQQLETVHQANTITEVKSENFVKEVLAVMKEDEKVIVQPPVYHPFFLTPEGNHRGVVRNPLKKLENGYYEMDFENLEKVADEKCKLLILSNPHNPAGLCWSKETLQRLAHFCYTHKILVVSDEIHCDMALWDNKHIPFATVSKEAEQNSITFSAPSKTFNIAGIVSSWAIVPNDEIREKFYSWLEANEMNAPHLFSPIATIAALREGEDWRREMLHYVEKNIDFVIDYCKEFIPAIKPLRPQASFLVWLDCRALGLSHDQLQDLFVDKAHLALNDGEMFGQGGEGYMRLNVAEPQSVLKQALEQLREAVQKHSK